MLGQFTEKYVKYLKIPHTLFDLNITSSTLGTLGLHVMFSPLSDTAVSPGHGSFNVDRVIAQASKLQGLIQ